MRTIAGWVTAFTAFAGCAPRPYLEANWFLAQPGGHEEVVIAILNRGQHDVRIYDVKVNLPPSQSWSVTADPLRTLAPGDMALLPAAKTTDAVPSCSIPVRIFVKTSAKQRSFIATEIPKPMPTAFPDWQVAGRKISACRIGQAP